MQEEQEMKNCEIKPTLPGAKICFVAHFLGPEDATRLFELLVSRPEWSRREFMGRPIPRSEIYMGDPGTNYTYSRRTYTPLPWIPEVDTVRQRIQHATGEQFNSVLMNLYRDGNDSVGAHSDAEREYGRNPVIASLSLGAARLFRMRQINGDGRWEMMLRHGDLLVMAGETQHNWRHEIPKDPTWNQPRINLTFRRIIRVTS